MPVDEHPALRSLVDDVLDAQQQLLQAFHAARPLPEWAGLSLTLHQLSALFVLFQRGPLATGRLGLLLGLRKPAATVLVDALVRHDLVVRKEDALDRRRILVHLSARGHTLINDHYTGSRQQFTDWLSQLPPEDLASLARGMQALATVASGTVREVSA
jgi:DNA-binding MarR family transcriptional regulator